MFISIMHLWLSYDSFYNINPKTLKKGGVKQWEVAKNVFDKTKPVLIRIAVN